MDVELIIASKDDAQLVFQAWGYNNNNFTYLSSPPQHSVVDAQNYLNRILANPTDLAFHIVLKGENMIVGLIKAKVEGHKALVGYVVDELYWRRGIASQAVTKIVQLLVEKPQISRIWATCATDNPASAKVLEKCGFIREGVLKRWIVYPAQGDKAHDNYCYCFAEPR